MITAMKHAFDHIRANAERKRSIARLQRLDDRLLRDIGLSRGQIRAAVMHGRL